LKSRFRNTLSSQIATPLARATPRGVAFWDDRVLRQRLFNTLRFRPKKQRQRHVEKAIGLSGGDM
jgi:hypothetical protein